MGVCHVNKPSEPSTFDHISRTDQTIWKKVSSRSQYLRTNVPLNRGLRSQGNVTNPRDKSVSMDFACWNVRS